MLLDDRIRQAKIHGKRNRQYAHGTCGQPKAVRTRHEKYAGCDRENIAAHEFQTAIAGHREQPDRAEKCARAAYGHQPSQTLRPKLEHVSHIQRQHGRRDSGKNKNRIECDEHDHGHDYAIRTNVTKTFRETAAPLRLLLSRANRSLRQRNERGDQREK